MSTKENKDIPVKDVKSHEGVIKCFNHTMIKFWLSISKIWKGWERINKQTNGITPPSYIKVIKLPTFICFIQSDLSQSLLLIHSTK